MRFIIFLIITALLGGCRDYFDDNLCPENGNIVRRTDINIYRSQIIFLMGNIYIQSPSDGVYSKVYRLSQDAQRELDRVVEVANSKRVHPFKTTGEVAGKIITCTPFAVGIDVMTFSLSEPAQFSDADFNRIMNESRSRRISLSDASQQ